MVGGGLYLWKLSNAPVARKLELSVVGLGEAKSLDVQILGPDGILVQRQELFFADGQAPMTLAFEAPLQRGAHRIRSFASLPDGGSGGAAETSLEVKDEETLSARLWFRRPSAR